MAINPSLIGTIVRMHRQGLSHSYIAQSLDLPYHKVVYVLCSRGLAHSYKMMTDEDFNFINQYYKSLSVRELAQRLECTEATIRKYLHKRNAIPTRNYFTWTQQRTQELLNLYSQGLVDDDIAKHFNLSRGSVAGKLCSLRKKNLLAPRRFFKKKKF